ncbi:guanylate kinase [Fructilactobacillus sanfranciscensis]|uniref:Guanylate kinase n=1 Tax=Fructilactobacillus sanfranciscensis TaxID=1625 RepID=A0A5C4TK90_FRUSA|nr:guanylate kinase [Fructilactobacillus sanfranciscensis]MCG7194175.1 guanylate kinase [Fructilactobacillus sanfranciscensis]MCG7195550.1 guanylate kinase [Fructilactobacillus sanfranciscensis]MDN4462319.1 guanylate kinase [Fructilactobacillus sanfranciscensis]MVF15145.1 guanylate kinase [Fructilactobacillus sanfranciscensis]NDR59989.1 guanylate kinase [Fructilactobacillus sanfranciscensis]
MAKRGMLIVLSGPSGVGKGTVRKALFEDPEVDFNYSISMTTRNPREGEKNGVDYYFVSKEQFEENIKNGEMLEYAKYVDNYYGTPLNYVNEQLNAGHDVFLEIEVNGALQVRANCPDGVFIFLTPPDIKELRSRLVGRGTDDLEVINKRIQKASKEIRMMQNYDYAIVNDKIKNAVEQIKDIVKSERLKVNRVMPDYLDSLGDEI